MFSTLLYVLLFLLLAAFYKHQVGVLAMQSRLSERQSYSLRGNIRVDDQRCRCPPVQRFPAFQDEGVLKSPGFPNGYCNSANCTIEFEPRAGWAVFFEFGAFQTEENHDYVEIWQTKWANGSEIVAVKLARLSGSLGRGVSRSFFSALDGGIRLVFISDPTIPGMGFEGNFRRFTITQGKNNNVNGTSLGPVFSPWTLMPCPEPFIDLSPDNISKALPQIPENFPPGASCAFLVRTSGQAVQVTARRVSPRFSLELFDTDQLRYAERTPWIQRFNLAKIESANATPVVVQSRSPSITVRVYCLTTSTLFSNTKAASSSSYDIDLVSSKSPCTCYPPEISVPANSKRSLLSPGYPLEYCNEMNCPVKVSLSGESTDQVLRIRFEDFQLEYPHDQLILFDGAIRLTGDLLPVSRYLTFNGPQASFKLITDESLARRGFNLTMEPYTRPTSCRCPGAPMHLTQREFTANFSFAAECTFLDCMWLISKPTDAKEESRLLLKVYTEGFRESQEFLSILSGQSEDMLMEHHRLDGLSLNIFTMVFAGRAPEEFSHFDYHGPTLVWVHRESAPPGYRNWTQSPRAISIQYQWRDECSCGQKIYDLDGSKGNRLRLTSPDFPHSYCPEMDCLWRVNAPPGYLLRINITRLHMEYDYDNLTVAEWQEVETGKKPGPTIIATSGDRRNRDYVTPRNESYSSRTNQIGIRFMTDRTVQSLGFEMFISAESPNGSQGGFLSIKSVFLGLLFVAVAIGALAFFLRANSVTKDFGGGFAGFARFIRTNSQLSLMNPSFTGLDSTPSNNQHQQQQRQNQSPPPLLKFGSQYNRQEHLHF